ncbi:hypothetical protein WS58_16510 [Burkholderia pseudomultivorans]|uniref:hypothetical protein n=1 Tax=Burkholderia pseudomultivorans TaxID=1207504 RepID=UPI00075216EA|nr:hypothetical protein [Burkholderia pseudomultivorans]AOI94077.1 hypothetical protein WS57_34685 [Burkholderia pseudomultivorans]KVC27767.1 hypothetical protein WS55_12880 [Burkholderia pseudomultivorans]KVC36889.1 hypothetical protein WS56_00250 [Burkholderia pseudomultivorans]KVC42130.1 hypothetical protein WS58_16510 [Burkholderia pseudomultivorans]
MAVELTVGSVVGIVMSSTVLSAVVNGWVTWRLKRGDRKREDAANAKRRVLAYRDAAYSLEAFAKQCDDYCDGIDQALPEYRAHDMQAFDLLDPIHLRFELPSESVASELNAERIDQLRHFREGLGLSTAWVAGQHHWTGKDDEYEFEVQRAIYFGSEACRLANAIRAEVGIEPYRMTATYLAAFEARFDELALRYAKRKGRLALIPELEPRMTGRHPDLPAAESEGDL